MFDRNEYITQQVVVSLCCEAIMLNLAPYGSEAARKAQGECLDRMYAFYPNPNPNAGLLVF